MPCMYTNLYNLCCVWLTPYHQVHQQKACENHTQCVRLGRSVVVNKYCILKLKVGPKEEKTSEKWCGHGHSSTSSHQIAYRIVHTDLEVHRINATLKFPCINIIVSRTPEMKIAPLPSSSVPTI